MSRDGASAPIEVEIDPSEPAPSSAASTTSTSIYSALRAYEWKHGRRYQQSDAYSFPNDSQEQDRLDMIHHVFYRTLHDRLFLAPLDLSGKRILDIGTGTGSWPFHLAEAYPSVGEIVATDISAIQVQWTPPAVKFIVDDVELDWVEPEPYDYIHCRYMAGSIKDWPRLVSQIFTHLKPGGWVEFQESANTLYSEDGSLRPDNMMVKMMDGLMEACDKIGRTMDPAPSMRKWTEEAGFVKVQEQRFKLPIGPWPRDPRLKEIGTLMRVNFVEGVEAFTAALFKDVLGWSQEEVSALNDGVKAAALRMDVHPLFDFLVVTAQKPE